MTEETKPERNTELATKLDAIRERIKAAGGANLETWEDVDAEVARRAGDFETRVDQGITDDPRKFLTNRVLDGKWERRKFDYNEFFASEQYKEFDRLAIGTSVVTDMKEQVKYIDESRWPCTDWEIAREYLRWIFETQNSGKRRKRIGFNKETWKMLSISQPLYFAKRIEGELAYVDIRHAYWQLYSPATLDIYFNPWKQTCGLGNIQFLCNRWLRDQRTVRNALVGIARSREHQEYRTSWKGWIDHRSGVEVPGSGAGARTVRTYNKFLAPELWGFLAFYLHQIAAHIRLHFDVHYVHTDGYILDAHQADDLVNYLAETWLVDARVKVKGTGYISAVARWRIEDMGSKTTGDGSASDYTMDAMPELGQKLINWRRWMLERA